MPKTNKIASYFKVSPAVNGNAPRDAHSKPGLYLVELRSHHAEAQSPLPKRKLLITVDAEAGPEKLPKVVKITHL
jgi:hypothetical protein